MKYNRILLVLCLFFILGNQGKAQEQLGLKLETYSGVNSLLLNPTNNLTNPIKWDLNIVSAGQTVYNNYGYVRNASVLDVIRNNNLHVATEFADESQIQSDMLILDYYKNDSPKFLSSHTQIMGPSFVMNTAENNFSFGLFTNLRAMVSSRNIPSELNYYYFNNTPFNQEFDVSPFDVTGMVWSEIGFNVARQLETYHGNFAAGLNFKILNGYESVFVQNNSNFTMSQLAGDSLSFQEMNLEYGFTNGNLDSDKFRKSKNGKGFAFDLGFSFIETGENINYWYKFGVSLLDIGMIKFDKNAERHEITTENPFVMATGTYKSLPTVDSQIKHFSFEALNDTLGSFQDNSYSIWMPSALSLQGDFNINDLLFINATLVQRIPMKKGKALTRDNMLAITPRIEHRWFSVMMPVSLHEYNKFRVGLSARLAYLIIGTEDLGSFMAKDELTGSDFYVGLKFNPFDLGWSIGVGKKGKSVRCYDF